MADNNRTLQVSVWRGGPSGGAFSSYEVPAEANQTVLDVVTWIQRNVEPALTYRFACRVGMCGSCAMMVNGIPRWTCRTHVKKVLDGNDLSIAPLRNLPVIKDLATNMDTFFDKWTAGGGQFHATKTRAQAIAPIDPNSAARREADLGVECINCAVCYAACDVVTHQPSYLGPATLNRAWTLMNDERDGAHGERLRLVSRFNGCQNCHSQQGCSQYCPNGLNPTRSIAGLKRMVTRAILKGSLAR